MSSIQWPLSSVYRKRNQINTEPDYQRPPVWTKAQKQLLIDTILREYDIPKFYLNKRDSSHWDVVDGQQRLRAIWEFRENGFPIAKDADSIIIDVGLGPTTYEIKGKTFDELDPDVQDLFESYSIDVVILEDKSDDVVQEVFLRMQNGTSLKAQEKRNAIAGPVRDYVKKISSHNFFEECVSFKNTRFAHDEVAAQMLKLSLNGAICTVKDRELNELYKSGAAFDANSQKAKRVNSVLNYLYKVFGSLCPELSKVNVISLFVLIMDLMENYDIHGREEDIKNWFIEFELLRQEERAKPVDDQDVRLLNYQSKLTNSPSSSDSIEYRFEFLKESLMTKYPDIAMKDAQRSFDEAQRQVIYRKNGGVCQMCGIHCDWDNWEADHIIPWSRGGKTEVNNGQVLCPSCNSSKGNQIQ